ncbi:MAG: uncharacterized membrane protein YbaN (DUF454 family) [Candidatus Endobugula sp.]|jgi:uncharacterized membrane protein YbaN (DUF454 family)
MKNIHYKILGFLSLGMGILGAFLPLLLTTFFILLSSWCFAKSSPKWHVWLVNNRLFGNSIQQWEQHHFIPHAACCIAIGSMLVSGIVSFSLMDYMVLRIALLIAIGAGIFIVYRLHPSRLCPVKQRAESI